MKPDFGQWTQGEIESMLQLTDPMGKYFVNKPDPHGTRWHCVDTNQDIAYALLDLYRQHNGVFGLPISGEIYLQQYPGTAIQYCKNVILVYDPKHIINAQSGAGDCYLLNIDSGIGQQAIAKPLLSALQTQVDTLTKQVASLTDELATVKAQPTTDTSALEAQISSLETALAAYKQAVANMEAMFAALAK
jgi:uncharacterized coiled-coil protein SlyX